MKNFIRFVKLPVKYKLIYAEAFILLGFSRFLIRCFSFRRIAGILGKAEQETEYSLGITELKKVKRISCAVNTMSKYTLWKSNCFTQVFAAKIMLRRRKLNSTVYLGVSRDNDNRMIAHAWVRCGSFFVTGGDGSRYFTITGRFS